MKRLFLILLASTLVICGFAQNNNPVSWKVNKKKTGPMTYELRIKATIKEPWYIYPLDEAGIAMPTEITFADNNNARLIGEIVVKHKDSEQKEANLYYSKEVIFLQTIQLKSKDKTTIDFIIEYMACTKQMCLPPSMHKFSVKLR
mgnify:CR=1 FL=1